MMNIVLLDDVEQHNAQFRSVLTRVLEEEHIEALIALEATRAEEVLEYARTNPPLTVYFLDIRLEQPQTGVDLCRRLRREAVRDRFIFVSAYPHYAMECLKVHAWDFLMKPVDPQTLKECVIALHRELQGEQPGMLDLRIGSRNIRLPLEDIRYIESEGRYAHVHAASGLYSVAMSMNALEEALKHRGFVRVHRKYIVNEAHIREWDSAEGTVTVGSEGLPLSRRMQKRLMQKGGAGK